MSKEGMIASKRVWGRILTVCFLFSGVAFSQNLPQNNSLFSQFQNPGNATRPRVWWHWMQGNITQDGIRKDLLWMHRSGIGGFQNFDAGLATPQVVDKRLDYMTPDWKRAFRLATRLADSLNLEMAIAGSPGWSQSGGPWVPAKNGMKKLVWREIEVVAGPSSPRYPAGPRPFDGILPKPFTTTGTFQNIPLVEDVTAFSPKTAPPPEYYEDVAVIAYRLPETDWLLREANSQISSSGGDFLVAQLTDGDLAHPQLLPADPEKGYAWLQYSFGQPQTVKALTLVSSRVREQWGSEPPSQDWYLAVSDDGARFRRVCDIPVGGVEQQTITIPLTTARYFRIVFKNPVLSYYEVKSGLFGPAPKLPAGIHIAEFLLHPVTRINHVEEKVGFAATFDLEKFPTPPSDDAVAESDIINLTDRLTKEGTLTWTPPPGRWKIVRFGYSLTGKKNHPASPEATGLEVDKLDGQAVKDYFKQYLDHYKDATGGLMGTRGLQYLVTDSYEAGQETWTPRMAQEFQKRRGYSLFPWMPVFTGLVVKSAEASERFLWDWRKTIAELIAENYYDQLTSLLTTYGMKRYSESHENGRLYLVDGMDAKRTAAVPMSAMWVPSGWGSTTTMAQADIRESASVAHIYGQNLVAAESLTAFGMEQHAWSYSPETLKPTADLELANGLNRFVIHTSVHQPVDDKIPGLGLFVFGQWFNRHDTWAPYAKSWTDYLARSSYLLQQGTFVADVLYYYGEDNNITGLFGHKLPDVPKGFNYDFINPHALLNLVSVKDGGLITPSGMSYQVLHLDSNARKMSLPVLRKIAALVKAGATISGIKPEMMASLTDNEQEFKRLVGEIWESGNARVHMGQTVQQTLAALRIQPDFDYRSKPDSTELRYVHRKLATGEIYWVNNRTDQTQTVQASFRVSGKVPQIWHPETGIAEAVSYTMANGRTTVVLHLTPNDALFVVFADPTTRSTLTLPATTEKNVVEVTGPWDVTFQANRGAPAKATFDKLISFTEHHDTGIKYFSGTATYTRTIDVSEAVLSNGAPLWLDLGEVNNIADVLVNGKSVGVVWKKPFRVDMKGALRAGENKLTIKVTNLWVNRLVGDQQPQTSRKITYTTIPFYVASSPLLPSGLLGPVRLMTATR